MAVGAPFAARVAFVWFAVLAAAAAEGHIRGGRPRTSQQRLLSSAAFSRRTRSLRS